MCKNEIFLCVNGIIWLRHDVYFYHFEEICYTFYHKYIFMLIKRSDYKISHLDSKRQCKLTSADIFRFYSKIIYLIKIQSAKKRRNMFSICFCIGWHSCSYL